MSRAIAWTDFRPMKVESLVELFSEQEFTSLILGEQHVIVKSDRSRIYPVDANVSAEVPSAWLVPPAFDVETVQRHYAATVKCEPLRFGHTTLFSLFDSAHGNMDALERLRRVFEPDLKYASEEQAAYMRLMRRQLLQVLVDDPARWAEFCRQMLARFPVWINFAFSLLPQMQKAVDPEQFMVMLNARGGGQTVLGYLTEQWDYIAPHLDALGCYHLLSAFCAPGVDQDPPQCLLDRAIELWTTASDAKYLSSLLFVLVARRDEDNLLKLLDAASAGLVAAINQVDDQGSLVLHMALAMNLSDEAIARLIALTDDVAQVSPIYFNRTPLHMACEANRPLLAGQLLRHHKVKASINARDAAGDTALHLAVRRGDAMLLALLLEGGLARGDALKVDSKNDRGHTVLHDAAMRREHQLMALLLQHTPCKPILDAIDREGYTALMLACYNRLVPQVRLLMQRGANAGVSNFEGKRAIDFADEEARAVLAADDVHRFQLTAHLSHGFRGDIPLAKSLYDFQGPAEYVRAAVFEVVKCLQQQMVTDTAYTRDVPLIRATIDQACERLYRAKSFCDINYELIMLHSKQHTWREASGIRLRSYLRSSTVVELQALGFVRDLAVTGLAYVAQCVRYRFWDAPARDPIMRPLLSWRERDIVGAGEDKDELGDKARPVVDPLAILEELNPRAVAVTPTAPMKAAPVTDAASPRKGRAVPPPSAPPVPSAPGEPSASIDDFLKRL